MIALTNETLRPCLVFVDRAWELLNAGDVLGAGCFSRMALEHHLADVLYWATGQRPRWRSLSDLILGLRRLDIISGETRHAMDRLAALANRCAHGQSVSPKRIDYLVVAATVITDSWLDTPRLPAPPIEAERPTVELPRDRRAARLRKEARRLARRLKAIQTRLVALTVETAAQGPIGGQAYAT